MSSHLQMIVVDNDTDDVVGRVIHFNVNFDGFSMFYSRGEKSLNFSFETLDDLLKHTDAHNISIYYLVGSERIAVTLRTYEKSDYLYSVGWCDLTPAEATLFGELNKEMMGSLDKKWLSADHLGNLLKDFGFTSTSLRMLLVNLRRKLKDTYYSVENKNSVGYRLLHKMHHAQIEVHLNERLVNSDYAILLKDHYLKYYVVESIEDYSDAYRFTGSQILRGWQGLTRTEAAIFFELVKHRGTVVSYDQLLDLPCMMRSSKDKETREKYLKNFVGKIRKKIAPANQTIDTEFRVGYLLKE